MANRVSAGEVATILETSLSNTQLDAFITTANTIVNDNLSGEGYSSTTLAEIEKWLAAHLASMRDQRQSSVKLADGASASFQGTTGMGLDATTYGQQVQLLETKGILNTLGLKRASFEVFGDPDYDELDID